MKHPNDELDAIDNLVTEAIDEDADGNFYVSRTKIRPLIQAYTQKQVKETLEELIEKDFIGKDYKGDDCISLARIKGKLEVIKARLDLR